MLAQAATYVACAPKSNSAIVAIDSALDFVKNNPAYKIPSYLQDAHYKGAAKLGHGIGYRYAHDYPNHYVEQQYLPDEIKEMRFYRPSDNGYEAEIQKYFENLSKLTSG